MGGVGRGLWTHCPCCEKQSAPLESGPEWCRRLKCYFLRLLLSGDFSWYAGGDESSKNKHWEEVRGCGRKAWDCKAFTQTVRRYSTERGSHGVPFLNRLLMKRFCSAHSYSLVLSVSLLQRIAF